jgi:ribose 5-phosphate isomerase
LSAAVKATLGVVEHGFFVGMADEVMLGSLGGGVETLWSQ